MEGLPGLSKNALAFLRRHPQEACRALETAAARYEALSNGASVDVPESLKPFIVLRPRSPDMLDVAQAAARLGVSRSTVYNWARNRKLLAWKPPGRRLTIPAKQILGPRKVVPGIAEVLDSIDDPELA